MIGSTGWRTGPPSEAVLGGVGDQTAAACAGEQRSAWDHFDIDLNGFLLSLGLDRLREDDLPGPVANMIKNLQLDLRCAPAGLNDVRKDLLNSVFRVVADLGYSCYEQADTIVEILGCNAIRDAAHAILMAA